MGYLGSKVDVPKTSAGPLLGTASGPAATNRNLKRGNEEGIMMMWGALTGKG